MAVDPGPRRPHCLTTSALPRPARRSSTRARHPHARNAHARNARARNAHAPGAKGWCPGVVGVRSSYSSFFATPKSRDRVLHLPQQTVANVTATRKVPPEVPPAMQSSQRVDQPTSGVAKKMNKVERTPTTPQSHPDLGILGERPATCGGAPLASIRFATPTLRNTWQAPHRNRPPRPMGGEGVVGGAPLSSYLSASPKCGQECRTPPQSFPRDVPASRHVPGETLRLRVWVGAQP